MRLATFNLDSLDIRRHDSAEFDARAQILRSQLEQLSADILCLQEVNSQYALGATERSLNALDALLAGTRYAAYERASSHADNGPHLSDVHNLVTLSRYKIRSRSELKGTLVKPPLYQCSTSVPCDPFPAPILLDRPVLITDVAISDTIVLTVINVHHRAPLATSITGQKRSSTVWNSTSGWAEGFFVSSIKRNLQALEVRLAVDQIMDAAPDRLIAVCGDFNADGDDPSMQILLASEESTGNPELKYRSMVVVDDCLPRERRFSAVHLGHRRQPDHIVISRSLAAALVGVQEYNELLKVSAMAPLAEADAIGSDHAPLTAEFQL